MNVNISKVTFKSKGPHVDPGLCRLCGGMKRCRIFNAEYEYCGQKEIYSDMLLDCFGLSVSHLDGNRKDRLVCATCVTRLREACAFRKQVLLCEEAFLQMKIYDMEDGKITEDILGNSHGFDVEVIKTELDDKQENNSLEQCDEESVANADLKNEDLDSNSDDVPVSQLKNVPKRNKKFNKTKEKRNHLIKASIQKDSVKEAVPMEKLQELIRLRDPSYLRETNIMTIIENSYVCPFKCKHNHLLCYYCGSVFSEPEALRRHTLENHQPMMFKVLNQKMIKIDITRIDCRLCTAVIDSMEDFKHHITEQHKKEYHFKCKDALLPFRLTSGNVKCAVCEMIFPYFHALNKHMNVHFSNFVCETCGLGFVDRSRFLMHQQRHYSGTIPCHICGKIFKGHHNRELHIDRVHNKRGRIFCPKCDVRLMSYPQKLKHLVEVHGEKPMSFPCNLCDKVCDTRRSLTIHLRKDHLKDYRYGCQYCGHRFFTKFALNNHLPTHTQERNFKCKVCEKAYPRLKTLRDHMRIHTNDRRYRCQICGQAFIQNCSLKGHMKSQHPEYG